MNNLTGLTYIDGKREDILAVSHKIWDYAELSYEEVRSSRAMIDLLKEEGFTDRNIVESCYPDRDFHTVYVGEIERVFVK